MNQTALSVKRNPSGLDFLEGVGFQPMPGLRPSEHRLQMNQTALCDAKPLGFRRSRGRRFLTDAEITADELPPSDKSDGSICETKPFGFTFS